MPNKNINKRRTKPILVNNYIDALQRVLGVHWTPWTPREYAHANNNNHNKCLNTLRDARCRLLSKFLHHVMKRWSWKYQRFIVFPFTIVDSLKKAQPGARIAWLGGEGARKLYFFEFKSVDQKKMFIAKLDDVWGKDQKKKRFSSQNIRECPQILVSSQNCANFLVIWGENQKKKKVFIPKYTWIFINSGVKPQKQTVFNAKRTKKQFLLTNSGVITSILGVSGLELLSSSTKHVNFFRAQAVFWGGYGPGTPPVARSLRGPWCKCLQCLPSNTTLLGTSVYFLLSL